MLKVNLGPTYGVTNTNIYREDNANTVADRVLAEVGVQFGSTAERRTKTR